MGDFQSPNTPPPYVHIGIIAHSKLGIILYHRVIKGLVHLRRDIIIAVHKPDIISPGSGQPGIPGCGKPCILPVEHHNALVLLGGSIADGRAVVR